jgi:RNA polymerase sigma factor (sigma-70 family)
MPEASHRTGASYPHTRISIILAARQEDPDARRAAFDALISVYWRPVYARLRIKWRAQPADAEDLTQEFFTRAMERGFFDSYDPAKGRFRTFLRTCLDRFAANALRGERRLKRGGGRILPLDAAGTEAELVASAGIGGEADADEWFDREWVRSLFAAAVASLRAASAGTPRAVRFQVFERYDLEPVGDQDRPSYRQLADEFGLPVTQVTNHLAWARRELRRLVLEHIRLLSGSDAEFRAEAQSLFGGEDG